MEETAHQKYCPKCDQWKPATTEYWHQGTSTYGLHGFCKVCRSVKKENPQKGGRPKSPFSGQRPCSKCGEADLTKFYYPNGKKKSICKKCDIEQQKQWQKENPVQHQGRMKRWREANPGYFRKHTYGLSPEEYQAMFEAQFGLCAICGDAPQDGKFHVDHCHSSNVVRSLLCSRCNLMIGMAKDNSQLLRKAAKYLDLHAT